MQHMASSLAKALVSCCPSLHYLDMRELRVSTELLAPLQGLSGLHVLHLSDSGNLGQDWSAVRQLTGLRELYLTAPHSAEGLLLQLTQLKKLTSLTFTGRLNKELVHARKLLSTVSVSNLGGASISLLQTNQCCSASPCWTVIWTSQGVVVPSSAGCEPPRGTALGQPT
jgi:hypothetical protein